MWAFSISHKHGKFHLHGSILVNGLHRLSPVLYLLALDAAVTRLVSQHRSVPLFALHILDCSRFHIRIANFWNKFFQVVSCVHKSDSLSITTAATNLAVSWKRVSARRAGAPRSAPLSAKRSARWFISASLLVIRPEHTSVVVGCSMADRYPSCCAF